MATFTPYGTPIKNQYDGTAVIDYDTDTIKCALVTASYTPAVDTHDFWDDVSANECSGTNYTAGGATLAGKSITVDTANNKVRFFATDPSWTTATITTIRYAVIYKSTGTGSTSPLMGYVDLGAQSVTAGTFTVDLDATNGFLTFSY